jgi:hypothetical protein
MRQVHTNVELVAVNEGYRIFTRGEQIFELCNHLQNVLVTISDKKLQHSTNGTTVDYYEADVVTANDYYPFGMSMLGRKYLASNTSSYRYSINGQEKESELNQNITTAKYWEYDSRIARRWNVDPKPTFGISVYCTFSNKPTWFTDPNGDTTILENSKGKYINTLYDKGPLEVFVVNDLFP